MCDYIEKIIIAALNGATDEKEIIISDMKSDITDLENSDKEGKDSLIEVLKDELSIVEAISIAQVDDGVEVKRKINTDEIEVCNCNNCEHSIKEEDGVTLKRMCIKSQHKLDGTETEEKMYDTTFCKFFKTLTKIDAKKDCVGWIEIDNE